MPPRTQENDNSPKEEDAEEAQTPSSSGDTPEASSGVDVHNDPGVKAAREKMEQAGKPDEDTQKKMGGNFEQNTKAFDKTSGEKNAEKMMDKSPGQALSDKIDKQQQAQQKEAEARTGGTIKSERTKDVNEDPDKKNEEAEGEEKPYQSMSEDMPEEKGKGTGAPGEKEGPAGELSDEDAEQNARRQLEGDRLQNQNQADEIDDAIDQQMQARQQAEKKAKEDKEKDDTKKKKVKQYLLLSFLFSTPGITIFLLGACVILVVVSFVGVATQEINTAIKSVTG